MTFEEFVEKVDSFYNENQPHMRYGQSIMNMLYQIWPDQYKKITGTDLDCFYDNGTVAFTLNHLEITWEKV